MKAETDAPGQRALARAIDIGLLLIVVLSPTQYALEVTKKVYLSLVDPVVWLVLALWIVQRLRCRDFGKVRFPSLYTLLFIALAIVSGIRAANIMSAFKDVFQFTEYFIAAYLLFASRLSDSAMGRRIVYVILGVACAIVAFGLVQYFTPGRADFDVQGTFGNRNVLGGYLSLMLPFCLGLLCCQKRWPIGAAAVLCLAGGMMLCQSGGTLLAVAAAAVVVSAMRGRVAFLAVAFALTVFVAFISPRLPRNTVENARASLCFLDEENGNQPSHRYVEWQAAGYLILDHPLLGVGTGNYQSNIGRYYGVLPDAAGEKAEPDSQNLYLVLGSSVGLAGLACFVGMLALSVANALRGYFTTSDGLRKGVLLGAAGGLIAFSINSVWSPLLVRGIGIPLAILLACADTFGRTEKTADEPE